MPLKGHPLVPHVPPGCFLGHPISGSEEPKEPGVILFQGTFQRCSFSQALGTRFTICSVPGSEILAK